MSCVNKFLEPNTEIIEISPTTDYTGYLSNPYEYFYYTFSLFENELITFNLTVLPDSGFGIDFKLMLYKLDEDQYIEVGISYINEIISELAYDGYIGEYYFCINSRFPCNFTFSVEYTSYPLKFMSIARFYTGYNVPSVEFAPSQTICEKQLYYEIIKGRLPPDLVFKGGNGKIEGIPDEQDCSSTNKEPPSFTWHDKKLNVNNGHATSTSKDWHIVVRAAFVENPENYSDRLFKLCVLNNWDPDRDSYMDSIDNFEQNVYTDDEFKQYEEYIFKEDSNLILCEPCNEESKEMVKLTQEEYENLCNCIEPESLLNTDIQINELCDECEIQEEPEFTNEDLCPDECDETRTLLLEEEFCPCDEEPEPEKDNGISIYPGIPEFCLEDFLQQMRNVKICKGPIVCPEKPDIVIIEEKEVKDEIEGLCPKC